LKTASLFPISLTVKIRLIIKRTKTSPPVKQQHKTPLVSIPEQSGGKHGLARQNSKILKKEEILLGSMYGDVMKLKI
jgi:LAS superfamily LD-carboxypeptidase LdcB